MQINNEAYRNLPDKFSRQHNEFTIGAEDSNNPIAKLRYSTYADMMVEFEILDYEQQRTVVLFSMFRDVALDGVGLATMKFAEFISDGSVLTASENSRIDGRHPKDIYRALLRVLTKSQIETLNFLLSRPPAIKNELKYKMKEYLLSIYGQAERAIILADEIIYGDCVD